jgi:hypothetical protein
MTYKVILCAGTEVVNADPLKATSARCVIAFADVSCHACALPAAAKLARFTVTGVEPVSTLLMTITVIAPSDARVAANAERLSGFGALAETLVSPKADLLPS